MRIVEIEALYNGAHRNLEGDRLPVPEGWAVIPEEAEVPESFPFVDLETEVLPDGTAGVRKMTPREAPEEAEAPEAPEPQEDMDAMLVDHELRITMLELGLEVE